MYTRISTYMDSELHFLDLLEGLHQAGSTSLISVGRDRRRTAFVCKQAHLSSTGTHTSADTVMLSDDSPLITDYRDNRVGGPETQTVKKDMKLL